MSLFRKMFATKSVEALQSEAANTSMKRTLGALDVVLLGVGDIIGTGIFVITGQVAAKYAGPAIVLSFVISAIACAFAGLCYAELAALLPVSGSAYVYTFTAVGELPAWIVGTNLFLEYLLGSALAAQGFTAYLGKLLKSFDVTLDPSWTETPFSYSDKDGFGVGKGYVNLPALLIVIAISIVLILGAKESAKFNHFFAALKIAVILLFLFATITSVNTDNWVPFIPGPGHDHEYGIAGVFQGASLVFLAYIGFDAVSTTAQEVKKPSRDMPIGILGSLVICTILYVLVSLNLTGIAQYHTLNSSAPMADAVLRLGMKWLAIMISVGAIAGLVSVQTVSLMSLPRVMYTVARDGLLPRPSVACTPTFVPIDVIAHMTSTGTLTAFFFVCLSVTVLRVKRPDVERQFMVPGGAYLVPVCGMLTCLGLIGLSGLTNIIRLLIWIALAIGMYMVYGRTHSVLNNPGRKIELPEWEVEEKNKAADDLDMKQVQRA
ncbi:amino acid permease-domain-containing protein [Catenaria anguillulae PL171]|uniref:Amino acid permease-domain-containing protein n=1 Tax=Catenaria anguillulae PL171 TaxID=765915 RepID=A0A1Y2HGA2_9FUNG|nr:amino acid permease-domain-containing protein [Catenaria anguillulae PL171]